MPLILRPDLKDKWLVEIKDKVDQEEVQSIIQPYPEDELEYYTVRTLRGKNGDGDIPEALEPFNYPELEFDGKRGDGQASLF